MFLVYENSVKKKLSFQTIGRLILISIHGFQFQILDTGFKLVASIGIGGHP